ncbi:hypothetical protein Pla123a_12750 [Posidoniimonas polymericola]|uniref:Uncharacterized protein n=1 Tax=Posidoniimonas polymericola TaxID=2528002 RepID=A0A5C5YV17_9BACT|nr:hypothetical protein [Posidoniimonas polymericola]TWT78483.1 hypothetical protein Pla123a_12750 [Posidoniimonas polymericola]
MDADSEQAVECGGCGRVYHVRPATEVRRAQCARCGGHFEIPLQRVIKPASRRPPQRRQSAMDHRTMAAAASRIAARQHPLQYRVSNGWWLAVILVIAAVAALAVFHPRDELPQSTPYRPPPANLE